MVNKKKKLQVLHVNLLKLGRQEVSLWDCEEEELRPEIQNDEGKKESQAIPDSQVEPQQVNQICQLEKELPDVFSPKPGCTH